jgi:hypothetical protein
VYTAENIRKEQNMINKTTALAFILTVIMAAGAFAQQYNPESDFKIDWVGDTNTGQISDYVGKNSTVNIPPKIQNYPVTRIGEDAFIGNANITSVIIPNGVTRIEKSAFGVANYLDAINSGCKNLKSVTLPDSLTYIGNYAFDMCVNLTSVIIPNRVTTIDDYAFRVCIRLTSVTIPNIRKTVRFT